MTTATERSVPVASPPGQSPVPIEHRFLGLDKRLIPATLGVLALVILLAGIIPAIDEAITADEIEPGTVFTVGAIPGAEMTFSPAPGWVVDGVPAPSSPTISVFDEGVTFTVSPGQFDGTPEELLDTIDDLDDGIRFEGERETFTTANGIPGAVDRLVLVDSDGALFALVARDPGAASDDSGSSIGAVQVGIRIVVDGPPQSLDDHADAIGQMIASVDVDFDPTGSDEEENG